MPAWWQAYLIAGELYSLHVVWRPSFEPSYQAWLANRTKLVTTPTQRVIAGSVAIATCTALWLPIMLGSIIAGLIAGRKSGGRR